jgi:hypothetical protein
MQNFQQRNQGPEFHHTQDESEQYDGGDWAPSEKTTAPSVKAAA